MSFFKKTFGSKPEPKTETNPEYIVVTLNDKTQPIDREEYYEEPLEEYLQQKQIGKIIGGGTFHAVEGGIEKVDIDIQLNEGVDPKLAATKIIEFLKNKNAPKNSNLRIENTGEEILFGDKEGIAIYLDDQNLEPEVYENSDINFVVSEVKKLIGDESEIVRFWEFPDKTALYFYGNSFIEMKEKIKSFMDEYSLCKNAEIIQIA